MIDTNGSNMDNDNTEDELKAQTVQTNYDSAIAQALAAAQAAQAEQVAAPSESHIPEVVTTLDTPLEHIDVPSVEPDVVPSEPVTALEPIAVPSEPIAVPSEEPVTALEEPVTTLEEPIANIDTNPVIDAAPIAPSDTLSPAIDIEDAEPLEPTVEDQEPSVEEQEPVKETLEPTVENQEPTVENQEPVKAKKVHKSDYVETEKGLEVTADGTKYSFSEPHGRHLSKLKKLVTSEMDEVEMLAVLMSVLAYEPKLSKDEWLDEVPLYDFQEVGKAITDIFQF